MTTIGRTLVVLLLLAGLRLPAHAQSAVERAKQHAKRGTELYDLGKYVDAAHEYEEAFKLSDRTALLYNVGQAYRLAGQAQDAVGAYRGFIRRSPASPMRAEAEARLAELTASVRAEHATSAGAATAVEAKPVAEVAAPLPDPSPSNVDLTATTALDVTTAPRPWWKRGWVWGVVAGAVVVLGVGVGLGVGLSVKHHAPSSTETVSF